MMKSTNVEYQEYQLDPAAEKLIGEHTFFGGTDENMETGEIQQLPDLTITITRELVTKARLLGWSGRQLFAEALRLHRPGAVDITYDGVAPPRAN